MRDQRAFDSYPFTSLLNRLFPLNDWILDGFDFDDQIPLLHCIILVSEPVCGVSGRFLKLDLKIASLKCSVCILEGFDSSLKRFG